MATQNDVILAYLAGYGDGCIADRKSLSAEKGLEAYMKRVDKPRIRRWAKKPVAMPEGKPAKSPLPKFPLPLNKKKKGVK